MGKELPVSRVFQDNLSALESLELQGRLLIDFTVKASITKTDIKNLSYQDVGLSVIVNHFEAEASFGSREPFTLELPIVMPGRSNEVLNFNLNDASFGLDFFVNSSGPIDIVELFSNDGDGTPLNIEYGGDLFVHLPLTVGMSGHNMRIDLTITDDNLFLEPSPSVDYVLDLCDIAAPAKELIELLKVQVLEAIKEPLGSLNVQINIDKVTDPLISKVETALADFTNQMGDSLSIEDCSQQSDQPSIEPSFVPSLLPSDFPTLMPSENPSSMPSAIPSLGPTSGPSYGPSSMPSAIPSLQSSSGPTVSPSAMPSAIPSLGPTSGPSYGPSSMPSALPSSMPSALPSSYPSYVPSYGPSLPPENPSLAFRIRKAIAKVNAILAKAGIALTADVSPYFDRETFSVGVEVKLNAQIRQSAENIVGLVSDFFNDVSNPPKQDPNLSKLGGNTSSSSLVAIDVNDLLQDTGKLSY